MFKSKKLKEENAVLQCEVLRLTSALVVAEEEKRNLLKKLELASEQKHNERGAGRMKTIQKSAELQIQSLLADDHKVSEIITILNE